MKQTVKRIGKKVAAVTLATAMALSISPMVKGEAKAKKPSFVVKTYYLNVGSSDTVVLKTNGVKIKSVKWSSTNKKVFTVKKKSNTQATIKGKKSGSAKIKAVVTAKTGKKYTVTSNVKVDNAEEMAEDVWIAAADPTLPKSIQDKLDKINGTIDGATYTGIAVLGYKLTAEGTYWRVLTKETIVVPGGASYYVVAELFESLESEVSIVKEYTSMQDVLDNNLDGGWSQCESPKLDEADAAKIYEAIASLSGGAVGVGYTPIAQVSSQVVAGKNLLLIGEKRAVAPQAEPEYFFIKVFLGLDGTVTPDLTSISKIEMDAISTDRYNHNWLLRGIDGVSLKEVWICYMGEANGKKWYNFGAIFANANDKDVQVDLSKFSFKANGVTGGLTWKTWNLPKNTSYMQWATTAISEDFLKQIKVGDSVEISFDGEKLGDFTVEDHSNK